MPNVVSKSQFKPHALEYFRRVQETGEDLIITEHAKPVLRITPYTEDPLAILHSLRGTVLAYEAPTEPVAEGEWEASGDRP